MPSLQTNDKTELPAALAGSNVFTGKAVLVGKRLELGGFTQPERLANHPLMVRVQDDGVAVVFRFGVVVLFGVAEYDEAEFISRID